MEAKTAVDILKMGIILEKRGYAFYKNVCDTTKSEGAKKIFSFMAKEEEIHVAFLVKQLEIHTKNAGFLPKEDLTMPRRLDHKVLDQSLKDEIDAAGYEAAAISAAIEMEQRAIDLYAGRAEVTEDESEKALYTMLADWERDHKKMLETLYNDLTKDIWNDNNYWYNDSHNLGDGLDI